MIQADLLTYLREQTRQGMSADTLRQELLSAGWRELDIENALHDVAAGLSPVTSGASIHEDLAQVRGMVAHLASRMHQLESRLASVGALGTLPVLPGNSELALPEGHRTGIGGFFAVPAAFVGAFAFGAYLARSTSDAGDFPLLVFTLSSVAALLLLVLAIRAMRHRAAVAASALCAIGITVLGLNVWVAWYRYQAMEWQTASGLGVLLVVLAFVMGRWIERYRTG